MTKTNEITCQQDSYLAIKNIDFSNLMEELDGMNSGFERIKIPAAGSTVFEMPGEDSENPEAVKEFRGVILHHHPLHAYYKDKFSGGNQPPDCSSLDGKLGRGNPGGECEMCPFNRFGTGDNGSKACKNRRRIYVLLEGEIFPMLLSLPTGSLKEYSRYIKRLLSKGKKSNQVVTKFSLKKATNSSGIQFSQGAFAVARDLSTEEYGLILQMSDQVKTLSQNVDIGADHSEIYEVGADEIEVPFL